MEFRKKDYEDKFNSNLISLGEKFPFLLTVTEKLKAKKIPYGLFAGTEVWLLTSSRETTDMDLLVADKDFENVISLFPDAEVRHKDHGDFITLLDKKIELSFNLNAKPEEKTYPFRLTELASKKREKFKINSTELYLLDPADTILLKAILQRGKDEDKHDFEDITHIINKVKIDKEYLARRFEECECDDRVKRCLKCHNLLW